MQIRSCVSTLGRAAALLALISLSISLRAQPQRNPGGPPPPPAPLSGPGIVVTYVESSVARTAGLTADLKEYAAEISSLPAKPSVLLLSEQGRPNRFVVLEQWTDMAAPSFAGAEALLVARTQPDVQAPIDRRPNHYLTPASAEMSLTGFPSTALFVLMHVDIRGAAGDSAAILQKEGGAVAPAPGALGYLSTVQDGKNNHFTVGEVWKSRAAYETYTATAAPLEFRHSLSTLIGAPFDDRLYTPVKK